VPKKLNPNSNISVLWRGMNLKARILALIAFFAVTAIAVACLLPTAHAEIDEDEDYDVGDTGSWTYAYISALWPPRYYGFSHDWLYDYAPGYWGPPPEVHTYPGEGNSAKHGYTTIEITVYQGANPIEHVHSEAYLPPPD
jgi:hypothetical protein